MQQGAKLPTESNHLNGMREWIAQGDSLTDVLQLASDFLPERKWYRELNKQNCNVFDVLTLTVADAFFLDGTIYAAAGDESLVLLGGTLLITAVLAAGLIIRDQRGIGFEGIGIPAIYAGTIGLALFAI